MWVGRNLANLILAFFEHNNSPLARLYASRTSGSRFSSHLASTPSTPPSPITPSPLERSSGPPSSVSLDVSPPLVDLQVDILYSLSSPHVQHSNQKDDQSQQYRQDNHDDRDKHQQHGREPMRIMTRPRRCRRLRC